MCDRKNCLYIKNNENPFSIMSEDPLNGSCMMSVHRERINLNKNSFIENVINTYGIKRRNLQFLLSGNETE